MNERYHHHNKNVFHQRRQEGDVPLPFSSPPPPPVRTLRQRRTPPPPTIREEEDDNGKENESPVNAGINERKNENEQRSSHGQHHHRVSFAVREEVVPSIQSRISFFSSSSSSSNLSSPTNNQSTTSPSKHTPIRSPPTTTTATTPKHSIEVTLVQEDDANTPSSSSPLSPPASRPTMIRGAGQLELKTSERMYQPPTHLHDVCYSAQNGEDIRSFLLRANVRSRDLNMFAGHTDQEGKLPLHIFSENTALSAHLYQNEKTQDDPDQLGPSTTSWNVDSSGGHRQVSKFLLDVLLAANPAAILREDDDGYIPFERALTQWINDVQLQPEPTRTRSLSSFSRRSSAAKDTLHSVWMSTSMSVSTAISWAGRSLHLNQGNFSTRNEQQVEEEEKEAEAQDIEVGQDQPAVFGFPEHVQLTSHVKCTIKLVSQVLDYLNGATTTSSSRKRTSLAQRVQRQQWELQSASFDAAMDSFHNSPKWSSSQDLSAQLLDKLARIPHFVPAILSLDDRSERDWLLSLSLVRSILLRAQSIGPWLPAALQSSEKRVSQLGLDYLRLVSQGLEETADQPASEELHEKLSAMETFIPSLLALEERDIEEASTTLIVRRVLDTMISKPFAVSVVFFDFMFLGLLMLGFRASTNRFLMGATPTAILKWIYVANSGIFYFVVRELGKGITILERTRQTRIYLWSFWNITDILSTLFALLSTFAIRFHFTRNDLDFDKIDSIRMLLAVTTGFLWLRVLSLLKTINMQLATFVLAILQITKDILWFLLIMFTLVASFAQMFYTLMLPSSCAADSATVEAEECSQAEYYLKVYTVLLGDFGHFERERFTTIFSVVLIVFFSFMVVIVLLNVLIAIVSDSYEKCLVRSQCLFGRARVMLVAELVSFQNLLRTNTDSKVSLMSIYTQWRSGEVWNKGLSHGSSLFFMLSSLVVVAWTAGEAIGYFGGTRHGLFISSLLSILVNVVLFAAIIWFLQSGHDDPSSNNRHEFYYNCFQKSILRMLGSTQDSASLVRGSDEWRGRVDYLQREMIRIANESNSVWSKQMESMERHVVLSECRIRSELTSLEDTLEEFKADIRAILQQQRQQSHRRHHSTGGSSF